MLEYRVEQSFHLVETSREANVDELFS